MGPRTAIRGACLAVEAISQATDKDAPPAGTGAPGPVRVEDVDFDHEVALVLGKGRRPRACPFGHRTGQALDRSLRVRARRADAAGPWLWLGKKGRLTETGVEQVVKRRGRQAGLPDIHPHQFRHTSAHQ